MNSELRNELYNQLFNAAKESGKIESIVIVIPTNHFTSLSAGLSETRPLQEVVDDLPQGQWAQANGFDSPPKILRNELQEYDPLMTYIELPLSGN
jgi:hypothetical protein